MFLIVDQCSSISSEDPDDRFLLIMFFKKLREQSVATLTQVIQCLSSGRGKGWNLVGRSESRRGHFEVMGALELIAC